MNHSACWFSRIVHKYPRYNLPSQLQLQLQLQLQSNRVTKPAVDTMTKAAMDKRKAWKEKVGPVITYLTASFRSNFISVPPYLMTRNPPMRRIVTTRFIDGIHSSHLYKSENPSVALSRAAAAFLSSICCYRGYHLLDNLQYLLLLFQSLFFYKRCS